MPDATSIAGHPYPVSYAGYGSKLCQACLDEGRGHVVLKLYWSRGVDDDFASLLGVCLRCQNTESLAHTVPMTEETKRQMTAPAVKTSHK